MTASLALGGLLAVSLAGKVMGLARTDLPESEQDADIVAFLDERGFTVRPIDHETAPVWIVGTRGSCRIRVADVPPEGWARAIVAEQTAGERLAYAFAGSFSAEQPVMRTRLENYRRRFIRYLGFRVPELRVRAVAVSAGCPPEVLAPEVAPRLSS